MTRKVGVLALMLAGCLAEASDRSFPINRCTQDLECWSGTRCNTNHGLCAAAELANPYTIVLQATPHAVDGLGTFTFPPERLSDIQERRVQHTVPEFVEATASIRCGDEPMLAEVGFYPVAQPGYPRAPVGALTRTSAQDGVNLNVRLPSGEYDVRVQPLNAWSRSCAPFQRRVQVDASRPLLDIALPELTPLTLTLSEASEPGSDTPSALGRVQRVRAFNRETGRVVSATVDTTVNSQEPLVLNVIASDVDASWLQVDLNPGEPWNEYVEVPLSSRGQDGTIRIPKVPELVTLKGGVELGDNVGLPFSTVVFTSRFPLPDEDEAGNGELDWCRGQLLSSGVSPVRCRAESRVTADEFGDFRVQLLPGVYQVLIYPNSEARKGLGAIKAVTLDEKLYTVERPSRGGELGPWELKLNAAVGVSGRVVDPSFKPLPGVALECYPVETSETENTVQAFNRTASTFTGNSGNFSLTLDTGIYDVMLEPPRGSNFPRLWSTSREFAFASDGGADNALENRTQRVLPAPLVYEGKLLDPRGEPLASAAIQAYGIVGGLQEGAPRSVLLGAARTDDEGNYTLLLPPGLSNAAP